MALEGQPAFALHDAAEFDVPEGSRRSAHGPAAWRPGSTTVTGRRRPMASAIGSLEPNAPLLDDG